jgi:uncharacterized protein YqgC (DUF456 family)
LHTAAWISAIGGIVLGGLAAFIPGFPGSAIALVGLVAFAALTDFAIVPPQALVVAALIASAGAVAQVLSPMVASRVAGGTAGAATGAAVGAVFGLLIPFPGVTFVTALMGSLAGGILGSREGVLRSLRGVVGTAGGCAIAVLADLLAVLGVAAVLAIADFTSRL